MWLKPKIDWVSSDYFNIDDYNRIKNNLIYLRELAVKLYDTFTIQFVSNDKTYSDYLYADEINTMETNLEIINNHTLKQEYGDKPLYMDNGKTMTYVELNRLENAILDLYEKMFNQFDGRNNLSFNFGMRGDI